MLVEEKTILLAGLSAGAGVLALYGCYRFCKSRSTADQKNIGLQSSEMKIFDVQKGKVERNGFEMENLQILAYPYFFKCVTGPGVLLSRILDEHLYDELGTAKTKFGCTLDDCIQPGVDNPNGTHSPLGAPCVTFGLVAGDSECYTVYQPLFTRATEEAKKEKLGKMCITPGITQSKMSDVDMGTKMGMDMGSDTIRVQTSVYRNLADFPFAPCIDRRRRRILYNILVQMCEAVIPECHVHCLFENKAEPLLHKMGLFEEFVPCNPYRASIGQMRDPFDARAFVTSADGSKVILINALDHLVFVDRNSDGDVQKSVSSAREMARAGEKWLRENMGGHFGWNLQFGYLTVLPEMSKTASVVKAEIYAQNWPLEKIIDTIDQGGLTVESWEEGSEKSLRLCLTTGDSFALEEPGEKMTSCLKKMKDMVKNQ